MVLDKIVRNATGKVIKTAASGNLPDVPLLWGVVNNNEYLSKLVNSVVINILVNSTPHRPYPFSLRSDYTCWPSMVDRSFTGRHLPPASDDYVSRLPDIDAVAELFKRPAGSKGVASHRSSVLFPMFAMWFTDGFLRTDPNDVRKNTSNHQIDLSQLYGLQESVTDKLRSRQGGKLKYQILDGEMYPPYAYEENGQIKAEFEGLSFLPEHRQSLPGIKARELKLFAMGTERANSTPGYIAFNTLFLREHNRICEELEGAYPSWDDERLFQTARNIMIVQLIKIVVEEYINHISPSSFRFRADPSFTYDEDWYRTNRMTLEFNLLYRWHALVPNELTIGRQPLGFSQFMYNTDLVVNRGVGDLIDDFSRQRACQAVLFNTADFLHEIEKKNIHLSRIHRLQSYNDYRRCFSLPAAQSFEQISSVPDVRNALERLYENVDDVEFYVGLYAEDRGPNALFGPLMTVMVAADAFSQALTNPLLAKNVFNVDTFSKVGLDIINNTNALSDVLHRNTRGERLFRCSLAYAGDSADSAS